MARVRRDHGRGEPVAKPHTRTGAQPLEQDLLPDQKLPAIRALRSMGRQNLVALRRLPLVKQIIKSLFKLVALHGATPAQLRGDVILRPIPDEPDGPRF